MSGHLFVRMCVDVSAPKYTDASQLDLVLGDRALTLVIWLLFACLWLLSSLLSKRCSFPLPLNFSFVLLETIPEYFFHLPFHSPSSCVFEVCLVKPPQQGPHSFKDIYFLDKKPWRMFKTTELKALPQLSWSPGALSTLCLLRHVPSFFFSTSG